MSRFGTKFNIVTTFLVSFKLDGVATWSVYRIGVSVPGIRPRKGRIPGTKFMIVATLVHSLIKLDWVILSREHLTFLAARYSLFRPRE